jgi:REP element-mobilizing transposase RayT
MHTVVMCTRIAVRMVLMPRGPRLDAPGCLHHVIARGLEQRRIFVDDVDRGAFVARLDGLVAATGTEVLAWALLPNHFHLLLRTQAAPLSDLMRALNTGYAVGFNRRHRRSGYVFQNRFKSFLVEEEPYLLELVRYIHLNPLRAGLVTTLPELDGFPWAGHSTLVGSIDRAWQATSAVLTLFGADAQAARAAYRRFIATSMRQEPPPHCAASGVRRLRGGWLSTSEPVRGRDQWAFDERILGSPEFVARVLTEQDTAMTTRPPVLSPAEGSAVLLALLQRAATQCGITPAEITSASHRAPAVAGRTLVAHVAVLHLGMSSNTVARFLGVSRQSVRRGLLRSDAVLAEFRCDPEALLSEILPRRRSTSTSAR